MTAAAVRVVLGSGGARGLSFIGVLDVLTAAGVPIASVAGSSMGALVGAAFCHRGETAALHDLVHALNAWRLLRPSLRGPGLLSRRPLERFIERALVPRRFEDLDIPLAVTCTNLQTGEPVEFSRGPLLAPVIASCLPTGLFEPMWFDGMWLADGGYSAPLPLHLARSDLMLVVVDPSVDPACTILPPHAKAVSPLARGRQAAAFAMSGIDTLIWRLGRSALAARPQAVVVTPELGNMHALEFSKGVWAVEKGAEAARNQIDSLLALLTTDGVRGESQS